MTIRVAVGLLFLASVAFCYAQNDLDLKAEVLGEFLNNLYNVRSEDIISATWNVSEKCANDVNFTLHNPTNPYAMKMLDSSAKIPNGLLQGGFVHMGSYDECTEIEVPNRFHGQHCMLDVNISAPPLPPMPLFYGVCVPSSCSPEEVVKVFTALSEEKNLTAKTSLDPKNCRTYGIEMPSAGDWVVVAVLVCFVLTAVASTAYDVRERIFRKNEKPHQLWSSFSVYTNGKFLLSTTKDPNMMTSLFGIRTITMGWVVLGHAYLNTVYSPLINIVEIPRMNKEDTHVIIFNSFLSVDTFFLLSGMLVCFVFFRNMAKNRTYDAPMGYVHRFLRLTPPLAAIVLLESTVFNYIGNGPMWNRIHKQSSENCKKYWWSILLYVQNYVNPLELCLTQSWYLSSDMQMYWISPLVLYPMWFFPMLALPYLLFLILGISFMDFAIVYVNELPANFALTPSNDRMTMDYYPFHTRMAPWLVGIALGYLICGIKAKKINVKLTPFWTTVGWIMSTVLMTASMQAMSYFNHNVENGKILYTPLESAFFLSFHRVGWALGLAWIIFACVTGIGGAVNVVLSFRLFQPLAKLSFCAYLIHISVQRFRIGYLRTNVNLGDVDVVWLFVGDFVMSNLVSIPLFLLFEQPFMIIERYFLSNAKIFEFPRKRPMPNRNVVKEASIQPKKDDLVGDDLKKETTEINDNGDVSIDMSKEGDVDNVGNEEQSKAKVL